MPLAGKKMERNDVMMSWERVARSNCNAEHDGCCSVRWSCWNALDGGAAQWLAFSACFLPSSLASRDAAAHHAFGFAFFFFPLDIIMSGL